MASGGCGPDPLHGYLKHGNLHRAGRAFRYLELEGQSGRSAIERSKYRLCCRA